MGVDPYRAASRSIGDPAERSFAVTPNDSNDLTESTRGLWVGAAGNLSLMLVGDTAAVVFVGVQAGSLLPLRVKRVRATGTTATDIVGVY